MDCVKCKNRNGIEEFWGNCQDCWDTQKKECDDWNKQYGSDFNKLN